MRAKELIEALPGATEHELNEIMAIIRAARQRSESWDEFEAEVNPLLAPYRIRIDRDDPRLEGHPGAAFMDGIVIGYWGSWPQLRQVLSHELVHQKQIERAALKGRAKEMYQSAHDRVLRGGKFNQQAYADDPHELMAYGRTFADAARAQGVNRPSAMAMLRRGNVRPMGYSPKGRKRFLKRAYQYAQDLPEGRDDIGRLPLPPEAKAYARRRGLGALKRQPRQYIGMIAAVTDQKARRRGFGNKDDGQKSGQKARLTGESYAASVYANAEKLAERLLE